MEQKLPDGPVAGLDEAGRGCLAGPVHAAAVILPADHGIVGLNDSKRLSPAKRESLARQIRERAVWSLGIVWPERIDRINILQASLEAMARAAASLALRPALLLLDGNQLIPDHVLRSVWRGPAPGQKAIVHGDALVEAISAASILAKTFRDRLMIRMGRRWPQYGFEKHKGYGVPEHLRAIASFGPCPLHRRSFAGVRQQATLS